MESWGDNQQDFRKWSVSKSILTGVRGKDRAATLSLISDNATHRYKVSSALLRRRDGQVVVGGWQQEIS